MIRQCAWCLRLINSVGERTSLLPVPKIYEATHGICQVCGTSWLESVGGLNGSTMIIAPTEDGQCSIHSRSEAMLPTIPPSPLPENRDALVYSDELCLIG